MTPTVQKRLAAVLALTIAGGALAFIAYGGLEENIVYYWEPDVLLEKGDKAVGATVRLGGVVKKSTVQWNAETLDLRFDVGIAPEPGGPTVSVFAKGAPPQMFREGIGVVIEGKYDGKVFQGERVLVKHSNEYRAPEPGQTPRDMATTLVQGEAGGVAP